MTSRPEPIRGSIGGRIRVILGDTGDEWLLLLNKDNGERKWQTQYWSSIPATVAKQINNCIKKDRKVTNIDFNGNGAWYIEAEKYDGTGAHHWWGGTQNSSFIQHLINENGSKQVYFGTTGYNNHTETYVFVRGNYRYQHPSDINQNLADRINKCYDRQGRINFIRLFYDNDYFISDDHGTQWSVDGPLSDELRNTNGIVHDVAKAEDGSWIVIRDNRFISSEGVSNTLKTHLADFYNEQRRYKSERDAEIRQYDEEQRRLAREARERAQQEERLQREREERERREREEREAAEARRIALEAEKAAEKARQEMLEVEKQQRVSILEEALLNKITEDANDIADIERSLQKRKQSLKQSLRLLPENIRPKISFENESSNKISCVICQHEEAIMAIVPCGHVCLCEECSSSIMTNSRQCPLCRAAIERIIRIYFGNN